jgi:hypothetical protein
MRTYIISIALIIIALTIFVLRFENTEQLHCIELYIPDVEYTLEYRKSADTSSTINTFRLDTIKLTLRPDKNEIDLADKIVVNLIRHRKVKTGIVIDFSETNYNGFVEILNIFIKNKITKVCFENEKIYFFPLKPPREYMMNRLYINKNFQVTSY